MSEAAALPPDKLANPVEETVVSVKGFDQDWSCRGFKYEIGQTYTHEGPVEACVSGFHACEHPLDVLGYYPPATSRYALVTQSGKLARHGDDTKIASAKITIEAELRLPDLIERAIKWVFAQAKPEGNGSHATGYRGAASATGDSGAASATGYSGAASATGYRGAASATGYRGAASATGDSGAASATGDSGAASATGDRGAASATGKHSVALAAGLDGRAMAADGCALFLVNRDPDDWSIRHAWAGIVGRDGIRPLTWYTLDKSGKPVEAA